jgi:hypothetical protein
VEGVEPPRPIEANGLRPFGPANAQHLRTRVPRSARRECANIFERRATRRLPMSGELASTRILLEPQDGRGYRLRCTPTTLGGSRGGDRRDEHGFARIATHDTPLPRKAACLSMPFQDTQSRCPPTRLPCRAAPLARHVQRPLETPGDHPPARLSFGAIAGPRSDEGRLGVPGRPSQPSN